MHQIPALNYSPPTAIQTPKQSDEDETKEDAIGLLYFRSSLIAFPVEVKSYSSLIPSPLSSPQSLSRQHGRILRDSHRQIRTTENSIVQRQAVSPSKRRTEEFLNVWHDDGGEDDVDNSAAVARLSKDFDLMFNDDENLGTDQTSTVAIRKGCVQCESDECSKRLEMACLVLSIITFIVAFLLAIQTITVQQFGSSVLCLVGSLVFLFLIFLQKKGLQSGTGIGCVIASLSVSALCLVVFAVWARDLVLLLSTRSATPSDESTVLSHQTLADVVQAKLFPNPRPQLWGCYPGSSSVMVNGEEIPVVINDLSVGCIISQSILGLLSLISALSSIGVAIVSSWICVRLFKRHRKMKQISTLCPTRLQRTISSPLTVVFNETGFANGKPNS